MPHLSRRVTRGTLDFDYFISKYPFLSGQMKHLWCVVIITSAGDWPEKRKAGRLDPALDFINWLRGLDLNQRPSGYEPDELPGCSTPRHRYYATCRFSANTQVPVKCVIWRQGHHLTEFAMNLPGY